MLPLLAIVSVVLSFFFFRLIYLLAVYHPKLRSFLNDKSDRTARRNREKVKTVVVLGSGGHTAEILLIVSNLNPDKYSKYYMIASTDARSYDKLIRTEQGLLNSEYEVLYIPRSREVHQSFSSSVLTTLWSVWATVPMLLRVRPELILCNGPGTCVPVCLTAFLLKTLFVCHPKIVFIESLCRVKSLSLTGKILRYFTDEFLVQWPELKEKYPETRYLGRL